MIILHVDIVHQAMKVEALIKTIERRQIQLNIQKFNYQETDTDGQALL